MSFAANSFLALRFAKYQLIWLSPRFCIGHKTFIFLNNLYVCQFYVFELRFLCVLFLKFSTLKCSDRLHWNGPNNHMRVSGWDGSSILDLRVSNGKRSEAFVNYWTSSNYWVVVCWPLFLARLPCSPSLLRSGPYCGVLNLLKSKEYPFKTDILTSFSLSKQCFNLRLTKGVLQNWFFKNKTSMFLKPCRLDLKEREKRSCL